MSLSELEPHVFAYYVASGGRDLAMAPRFWPYGELVPTNGVSEGDVRGNDQVAFCCGAGIARLIPSAICRRFVEHKI